jgi:hypothetical protein
VGEREAEILVRAGQLHRAGRTAPAAAFGSGADTDTKAAGFDGFIGVGAQDDRGRGFLVTITLGVVYVSPTENAAVRGNAAHEVVARKQPSRVRDGNLVERSVVISIDKLAIAPAEHLAGSCASARTAHRGRDFDHVRNTSDLERCPNSQ